MNMKETLYRVMKKSMEQFTPYSLLYEQLLHLPFNRPIYIFSLGTAAYEMAEAVLYHASLDDFIRIKEGLIITRYGNNKGPIDKMQILEANHLYPDESSLAAGEAAIEFLKKLQENDILIVLLSGGGSALIEKPVVGIDLDEFNKRIQDLYNAGAGIEEIERARKNMSEIKGGKLQQYINAKEIHIYAMSDIPGDIPRYIASNPFDLDSEETIDEMGVDNYHRFDNLTSNSFVQQHKAMIYKIVANNRNFLDTVRKIAIDMLDFLEADSIFIVPQELSGEAQCNGRDIVDFAGKIERHEHEEITNLSTPCLLIFGGIISANVAGRGNVGRTAELAMAAVEGLSGMTNASVLVYNTSGVEIFYDTAGAFVDTTTKQTLQDKGISVKEALEKHQCYDALKAIDSVLPGENSTLNVNEVVLVYVQ